MQFISLASLVTLLVAGSATAFTAPLEKRTNPKANEYSSIDCTGPINFHHASASLPDTITMDPSSHSVYLAGASWMGWTIATADNPVGDYLGYLSGECNNLDTTIAGSRIARVSRWESPFKH